MSDNDATSLPTLFQDDPIALSATMSGATINAGKNLGAGGTTTAVNDFSNSASNLSEAHLNLKIDNPQFAYAGDQSSVALDINRTFARQISTSIQPIFIAQEDINFSRIKTISNKLFSHLGYTCTEGDTYTPYWGVGFELEWAGGSSGDCGDCDTDCDKDCETECSTGCETDCESDCSKLNGECIKAGLSQWGVWARFGLSFQ